MTHFIAFFITISVLVMFLGSKQKTPFDRYALSTSLLFSSLTVASAALLQGTLFFPGAALALALLLVVHRAIVHIADINPDLPAEPSWSVLFRCRDACHHETWVIAALTAAVVSVLRL